MGAARRFYGRWARLYDYVSRWFPGIARVRRRAAATLEVGPGDRVVEFGCGTGANFPYLRDAVGPEGEVVGVDFTGPSVRRARDRIRRRGWENVSVLQADATAPPIEAADGVLATFVMGMLDDPAGAVADWCDRSDGTVVLADAAPAGRPYGPLVNPPFRAFVTVSTPPTTRLRYERDLAAHLDERVSAAHAALRDRATAVASERHLLGLVRLAGGRLDGP